MRFGTQKEWITSADIELDLHRPADRDVDLVGGGEAAARVGVLVADLPPPLVAGDADRDRLLLDAEQVALRDDS